MDEFIEDIKEIIAYGKKNFHNAKITLELIQERIKEYEEIEENKKQDRGFFR